MVEVGGNSSANAIYEAYIPKGISKPKPNATIEERTKFIRSKYEFQEFLKPSLRMISSKSSFKTCASGVDSDSFYSPATSRNATDASISIGTLKVKVVRGINLAIRDFRSSDPYVILALGQQKVKTSVKQSNLNPVWNEELKLTVPQRYGALKLQVYDYDTFSADDIMGEAEVDLQPFIAAATVFSDEELPDDMQVGKWLKSSDNALMKDSTINIIGGKIKQEIHLKLQNVESGELELELEWIPLHQ
ncbi:ADP-ribosylation factor GTPase-activating protein AGD12 [Dendrobium catenatum]|uniref:ADP-ribosylation factor GTPase-activating protein AGD12 n=3 Tax=Dendrobium catenatum TaxID=906689 RepID=A0A2I0VKR0_9ASPA|nr:ADP-ribosylation factor GTPase-activating protein AGD12 [Dendrobium catenatum]